MPSSESKKPHLEVIQGERIDPEDVDDREEELETLAHRVYDDIRIIDTKYDPAARVDQTIMHLRNGLDIIAHTAEGGDSFADETEKVARAYIENGYFPDPKHSFRSLMRSNTDALTMLGEAMFQTHPAELAIKFKSEAWRDEEVRDALIDGMGEASSILAMLCPKQEDEDVAAYRQRLVEYLGTASTEIRERGETAEF